MRFLNFKPHDIELLYKSVFMLICPELIDAFYKENTIFKYLFI